MAQEEIYAVVMHLNRWDRTRIALSWSERIRTLLTGQLTLNNVFEQHSVGWVPVFEDSIEAEVYRAAEAPGAQITLVRRHLEDTGD